MEFPASWETLKMNFDFSEEQNALKDLSEQIFEGTSNYDRVEEIERPKTGSIRQYGKN